MYLLYDQPVQHMGQHSKQRQSPEAYGGIFHTCFKNIAYLPTLQIPLNNIHGSQ
jgi:hypothetical protein